MSSASKSITVAMVDANHLVRQGIKSLLLPHSEMELVGEGMVGDDVFTLLEKFKPDILLLDLNLPQHHNDCTNQFQISSTIKDISENYPETAVIILTRQYIPLITAHLIKQGIRGFLLKGDDLSLNLPVAMMVVHKGGAYFSETVIAELFSQKAKKVDLTRRQIEVLTAIATTPNASYIQQANNLSIAESTLKNHLTRAFKALGVKNITAAVLNCIKLGLIPLESI